MNKLVVSIILTAFLCCLSFGQTKQPGGESTIQEVAALETKWLEAARQYDVAWFERTLADSYTGTDWEGVVRDKAAVIANIKKKAGKIESVSYEGIKVRTYGNVAIATGVTVRKGSFEGKDNSGKYAWTDTWVKLDGRWQCVAEHGSKIASK